MNLQKLFECLDKAEREVIGIPYLNDKIQLNDIVQWVFRGIPQRPRQIWFVVSNADQIRDTLQEDIRSKILPIHYECIDSWLRRGPFDSLLLPVHGFAYQDPNLTLSSFWLKRGSYTRCEEFTSDGFTLWFWESTKKPLKLYGLDHHHAVLWDAKQIIRPLGVRLDFTWLSDGRPSVNEAVPSSDPPFFSSLDIYRKQYDEPLDESFKQRVLSKGYDGILTAHSLVTTYRLKDLGLPMFHINSTRFGNSWRTNEEKHRFLVQQIQTLLDQDRLKVVHNNRGDREYFLSFFPTVSPSQEVYTPSLCESSLRLRVKSPTQPKFLIWDTRQTLIKEGASPFMKELYVALKTKHSDLIDSQALLLAERKNYLAEGYLNKYTAVIHLPYNISTMSIYEQTTSNIPVWVPSLSLLKKLWLNKQEPNELSWTVFEPGSEQKVGQWDRVRESETVDMWVKLADFYNGMSCIQTFDSIEDLCEKLVTTNYDSIIDESESKHEKKREEVFSAWEQVLDSLRKK